MKKILPLTRRPDITFKASGEIYITSRIARILHLDKNSCINIIADNGEYLLTAEHYPVMIGSHAAKCYPVNSGYKHMKANSVTLCRAILNACGVTLRAALMCGEATKIKDKICIPIITKTTL